jgi:predicted DNA-binding protein with PD1-like motif
MHSGIWAGVAAVAMLGATTFGATVESGLAQTPAPAAQTQVPAGYIATVRKLEHGKAPRMTWQVVSEANGQRTYAVIFLTGDELLAGLTEFAEQQHIAAARVTGIGAISHATLGWLDLEKKAYKPIVVSDQVEVTSMVGDIAELNGKPSVHLHLTVAHQDGTVTGGHLIEAFTKPTLEVIVTEYPKGLHKELDPEVGMTLIRPK